MITDFLVGNLAYPTVLNCLIVEVFGGLHGDEWKFSSLKNLRRGGGGGQNKMTLQKHGD